MKYKTIAILACGTVILAMLSSCRYFEEMLEEDYGISIYNATGDTICIYEATGYYVYTPTAYPDTILPPDEVCWKEETISYNILGHSISPIPKDIHIRFLTRSLGQFSRCQKTHFRFSLSIRTHCINMGMI